ncbi:hypothetical protein DLAC_11654 [Tieghemostelium lacteum]|uniref:palmitoyl-protein hydrolase n=1 Tax=Tieghemostelium lacteum TaxID=361077 RepID=A0A151ZF67_TIELA|nr:hypothetical protein DLAC_11654 [Tieghemostelium lacteum]|eukprot:KYQ92510.1 hypothetical protein DLAC_11654 [Tieghemostelium lacteum]
MNKSIAMINGLILPPKGKHTATVIFSHGLGDSAQGWIDVVQQFHKLKDHDHIKFVLPTAPVQPVSINGGISMNSWYDIKSLQEKGTEDKDDVDRAKLRIDTLIQSEVDEGISSDRIIIGGFSQGAALSIYTFYQSKHKLAGCMALSGYLPIASKFEELSKDNINKSSPMIQFHGEIDQVVKFDWGKKTNEVLANIGCTNLQFIKFSNLGHSCNFNEVQDMDKFLRKYLPKQQL